MISKIIKTFGLFIAALFLIFQIGCTVEGNKATLDRPENVRVVCTENDVTIFFDPVENADSYYIYVFEAGDEEAYYKYYSSNPSELISGVTVYLPDGTYKIQVQAIDSTSTYSESKQSKSVLTTLPYTSIIDNPDSKEDTYSITYVLNGGLLDNPVTSFKTGDTVILAEPTKTGAEFIGWYTETTFVNKISVIASSVHDDIILYAKWSSESSSTYEVYYQAAEGLTGTALKNSLRKIISTNVKTLTYADLKTYLPYTDQDPDDSSKMLLVYSGEQVNAKWDGAITWNREHIWPQSKGWFTTSGAGADLHHIRPEDPTVNDKRANLAYGYCSSGTTLYYNSKVVGKYGTYFEPLDEYKGDIARIIFYLLVRYAESDKYNITTVAQSMEILLEWNELDPVSNFEKLRNERTYSIQGNRNPFIDHPEFADMIW